MSDAPMTDEAVLRLRQEREAFIDRVRENERLAAAEPARYRRRLRGLVLLGYAYIGAMLLVALALAAALVAVVVFAHRLNGIILKLGLLVGVFLFGILRSLWVKVERPGGLLLTPARAPALWREVGAVASALGVDRPDEIRLDEAFNASAAQWPRFGIFGGYRSTLTLGLPLLASLSREEALGVVAHEFGHFSGKHGRFGVWIYRVNSTWAGLAEGGSGVFRPFLNWFGPRFAATSFALRRQHEYEADRAAAEVVGAEVVAGTLARLDALGEHQQRAFWDPLDRAVERGAMPANGYFARMAETLRQPLDHDAANRRLAFALAEPTDYDDSHPSLTDRLRSLGEAPPREIAPVPAESAAQAFFGDGLPSVAAELEDHYAARMGPVWAALAARQGKYKTRLSELERATDDRPPSEDEAVEMGYLRAHFAEPEESLAILRGLHGALPQNAQAAFLLGERLLDDEDPAGVPLLRFAADHDADMADAARALLARYHARQGDHSAFATLRDEAQDARDRQIAAESAVVPSLKDDLLPPDLTPEERERVHASLKGLKGLGHAYAFRKRLPGTGELRDYLYLAPKPASLTGEDTIAHFTRQFGSETDLVRPFTIVTDKDYKAWKKRLEAVAGAKVYDHRAK